MGEAVVASQAFRCGGCGRTYRWVSERVGKLVRCECGKEMAVPMRPEGGNTRPANGPAHRGGGVERKGVALGYEGKGGVKGAGKSVQFPDRVKDLQVPVGLLGAGVVVEAVAGMWGGGGAGEAVVRVGVQVVVGTVLMVVALMIAGKLRGIDFGPVGAGVLKLAALAVAPSAAMTLLTVFLVHVPLGMIGVWVLGFCFYFALVGMLFDLDQSDTWYCVVVIFLVKVAVAIGVVMIARGA